MQIDDRDFSRAFSSLKRGFSRSIIYKNVIDSGVSKELGPKGGKRYECAICKKHFARREIQVDHIRPVVPIGVLTKDMTFCEIFYRTYCHPENLQVLCSECHKVKSKEENIKRRTVKNAMSKVWARFRLESSVRSYRR